MSELLAKSAHGDRPGVTLFQHTIDVMNAAEALFGVDAPTRLGQAWLRFFKVPGERFHLFRLNLLASAAFHDWGKANDGFQDAVTGNGEQVVRHEHLSGLMLALDTVVDWLKKRPEIDADLVLSAVLTHHLKVSMQEFARPLGVRTTVRMYDDHPDFARTVGVVGERLGLPPPQPPFARPPSWAYKDDRGRLRPGAFDLEAFRDAVRDWRLRPLQVALRNDDARRRMLWAVRAGLIAADAAGSGLPRVGALDVRAWIEATFDPTRVCDEAFVSLDIIGNRIEELNRKKEWRGWSEFQDEAAGLPSRALLLAPCGSGKTLAAWRWIAARVGERPAAHVLFLYPTRATAKEGFRDYVSWAPEADAALMHGTSAFDLQGMFANPDDPGDPRRGNRYEADRRLFALGFWGRRAFSATVDQFLAFLQYGYGPVCMLPVLADAVVVIDEVHSFDRSMFSALKEFLKLFDVPVLCMTATLPVGRREELVKECRMAVYDAKPGELKEVAQAPRYHLRRVTAEEASNRVRAALVEGRRVLWVVNQVKRAQQAAMALACDFSPAVDQDCLHVGPGVPLLCYHSRFRLADRMKRHEEVVAAFRRGRPARLAVATQVCEMSLDMDADLLVTEACPVTALIQRMGRCNRERRPRPLPYSGEILVYTPDDMKPYDAAALTGLEAVLDFLSGREAITQADLEDALERAAAPPSAGDAACSFTASGPYAMGGEEDFRDAEEFNAPAVLKRDVAAYLAADKARQPGLIVPVPRKLAREARPPNLPSYLGVAPDGHYHQAIGFCDRPLVRMGGTD